MTKIYFATGNKHKFAEVKKVFDEAGIEIEQLDVEKPEIRSDKVEDIAEYAAEKLANETGKTLFVDDTGIYFKAYPGFPGPYPKFVADTIGYDGIFRLLEGKDRSVYFKTVAAFCEPGKEVVLFDGVMDGTIINEVRCKDKDVMPYERIFAPEGYDKVWAEIPEVKKNISHRVKAFKKLAEWLKSKNL